MLEDTLLVRHLPSSLSHEDKSDFLRHFGAIDVKIVGPESRKTNLVYARYESTGAAKAAIKRLHQLNVLGQVISAEIARDRNAAHVKSVETSSLKVTDEKQDKILKAREAFLKKLGLSIKSYDFDQPPPLNLYYQYPPPTRLVLENICKAMANTPHFYNQVLHLMNKMNLPCPFTDKYPLESDLFQVKETNPSVHKHLDLRLEEQDTPLDQNEVSTSENESEMGSDTERTPGEIIPAKRKKIEKKAIKRPKFVKPQVPPVQNVKTSLKPDDVFESTQKEQLPKKIELKITADLSSIQEAKAIEAAKGTQEGFQVVKAPQKVQEKKTQQEEDEENKEDLSSTSVCISAEELAANRIPTKDLKALPVFKNYQPGAPSCRLYIKNLSKQVQSRDLHYIFRRYYRQDLDQEQGSMFDIRLMQEGRMKGQAFITLQNTTQAQQALKETNGFILKDKPMVVQFARSAAAK